MVDDEWQLIIIRANNGYILKGMFGDRETASSEVIEECEVEDSELKAMKDMLYQVKEYFGIHYSKHDNFNIEIAIKETGNDGND